MPTSTSHEPQSIRAPVVQRIPAIDGLRAWLAWLVVASHVVQVTGVFEVNGGHWIWLVRGGEFGVLVFIVISGFVITGLVLEKGEPWLEFIVRRAFRIFPAFLVAYAFALTVFPIALSTTPLFPWVSNPAFTWDDLLGYWRDAMHAHPVQQLLLHALLLQGAVPDSFMPFSSNAVLGPAWSLSLEWQFYLIAPFLIAALADRTWRFPTVATCAALTIAATHYVFGEFYLPSFLPCSLHVFLIGIACRFGFDQFTRISIGPDAILLVVVFVVLHPHLAWLAVWAGFFIYLTNRERWDDQKYGGVIARLLDSMFRSSTARYLGDRSYSVYVLHLPIIELVTRGALQLTQPSPTGLFWLILAGTVPATLILSDLIHRFVEKPMIAVGSRIAHGISLRKVSEHSSSSS